MRPAGVGSPGRATPASLVWASSPQLWEGRTIPLNTNGRNAALGGVTAVAVYTSLHTAIPDNTGSNEVAGGTYARVSTAWSAASGGTQANSGSLTHNVPASTTVVAYGLWSASTSGTFYGWLPLNGSIKAVGTCAAGDVTSDTITSPAHGLANGDRVYVTAVAGATLPAGLSASTLYYTVSAATDSFKVSLTSGGTAVDITGEGDVFFQKVVPEVFGAAGTLSTAAGALVLDATTV